jgi:hypothetical protein
MIQVDVTELDIDNCIANLRHSPLEVAAARALKVDVDRVEVKHDKVWVWMYDDSDYLEYEYSDEESYLDVYDFINEWEVFMEDESMEEFLASPFSFNLEEHHDPRTDSRHWAASSFDYSEFEDDPTDGFRKKSRKHLTEDDDWV